MKRDNSWPKDPYTAQVYLHILNKANVDGTLVTSQSELCDALGITRSVLRTQLARLARGHVITLATGKDGTRITIKDTSIRPSRKKTRPRNNNATTSTSTNNDNNNRHPITCDIRPATGNGLFRPTIDVGTGHKYT